MKMLMLLVVFTACSSRFEKEKKLSEVSKKARSDIHSSIKKSIGGFVELEEKNGYLIIQSHLSGLKPSTKLGFHIHEFGICEGSDYKTAGAHYNPDQEKHGGPDKETKHAGDLGNIQTDKDGKSFTKVMIKNLTVEEIVGKSILIHERKDDLKTQPSGNSGKRIACGLIKPVN